MPTVGYEMEHLRCSLCANVKLKHFIKKDAVDVRPVLGFAAACRGGLFFEEEAYGDDDQERSAAEVVIVFVDGDSAVEAGCGAADGATDGIIHLPAFVD